MSNNPYDRYPGFDDAWDWRFPDPGLTDAEQALGLQPRPGDINPLHDFNHVWGTTIELKPFQKVCAVTTQAFPFPRPIAYQLRFADNKQGPYTPTIPLSLTGTCHATFIRSLDAKADAAVEIQDIVQGQAQETCQVIARLLTLNLEWQTDNPASLWVQAVACPIEFVDCDALTGQNNGYGNAEDSGFYDAGSVVSPLFGEIAANPQRKQIFIQNTSNQDLYIIFQRPTDTPLAPTATFFTIKLPGGINAIYESPIGGFTGQLCLTYLVAGTGGAMVTEGLP